MIPPRFPKRLGEDDQWLRDKLQASFDADLKCRDFFNVWTQPK